MSEPLLGTPEEAAIAVAMNEPLSLFSADAYITDAPWRLVGEDWETYWNRRWPCRVCGGTPLSDGEDESERYPAGADPCLGWLPGMQFACCGHGRTERAYAVAGPVRMYMGEALEFFRSLGSGPPQGRAG